MMADCLYQCLKEAKLEKYFRNFVNGGLQHCESLLHLSMQEYPRYGVVLMEDRLRLFKLIQIVKSVQAEGMVCKHGNSHHGKPLDSRHSAALGMNNRLTGPSENTLRPVPLQVQQVNTAQSHINAPQRATRKPTGQVVYKGSGDSPVFNCRKTLKFSDSDLGSDSDDSVSVQLWDTHNNDKRIEKHSQAEGNQDYDKKAVLMNGVDSEGDLTGGDGIKQSYEHLLSSGEHLQKMGMVNGMQTTESMFLKACEPNTKVKNVESNVKTNSTEAQFHDPQQSNNMIKATETTEDQASSVNKENIAANSNGITDPSQGVASFKASTTSSNSNTKPAPQAFFINTSPVENSALIRGQGQQRLQGQTSHTSDHISSTSASSHNTHPAKCASTTVSSSSSSQTSHIEKSQNHMIEQGVIYKPMSNEEQRHIVQSQPKPFHFKNFHPPSGINGGHHSYFPAGANQGSSTSSSSAIQKSASTHVEKVYHNCGYAYGVPSNAVSGIPSERKQSPVKPGLEKIRVCVRKRPLLEREAKRGEVDVITPQGANTVTVEETKMTVNLSKYLQQHMFKFDEVFGESCDNKGVYDHTVKPLIQLVFNRGSATCFAFGQTGSGKSYTLLGNKGVPGLYQLAATDIFSYIDTLQASPSSASHMHLWASYYEIYCSNLFDLLNKRKRLHVRENSRHKVCIVGLMETEVHNVKGLVEVVQYGNASRSTGVSGNNSQSSRSHAVLQLEVRDAKDCKVGRLSFIDLAGSERATDMTDGSDKQTRIEGAEINQSLLALKECIRSLDQDSGHTPYRQSKLTHILRDSFIGNSHTVMIANVSPCMSSCVHTLNTLKYADRVKELKKDQEWKLNNNVTKSNKKPATPKQGQWSRTPSSGKSTDRNSVQRSGSLNRHMGMSASGKKPGVRRQASAAEVAFVKQMESKEVTPDKGGATSGLFMGNGMQFASTPKAKGSPSEGGNPDGASPFDVSKILREDSDTPIRGHKLNKHAKDQKSGPDPVGPTRLDFENMTEDFEILGGSSNNQKHPGPDKNIQGKNNIPEGIVNINEQQKGETGSSQKIFIGADKVNELIRIQKERLSVGKEDLEGGSSRSRSRVKSDRESNQSPQPQVRSKSSGRVLEGQRPKDKVERRSKSIEKGLPVKKAKDTNSTEERRMGSVTKTPKTQNNHDSGVVSRSKSSDYSRSRSRSNDRLMAGSYPIKSHDEIMAEHKEVLDHLDSLLDRAKAAITNSPPSSPSERKSELKKQCSVESSDSRFSETTTRSGDSKPLVSILKKTPTSEGSSSIGTFVMKSAGKEKLTPEMYSEDYVIAHSARHSDPLGKERYFGGTSTQVFPSSKSSENISQKIRVEKPSAASSGKGLYDLDNDVIVLDDSNEGRRMDSPCIRPSGKQVFPLPKLSTEKHAFGPSNRESAESSRQDQLLQRSNSHGSVGESERSNSRNMSWHDILSQSQNEGKSKDSSFNDKPYQKVSRSNSRDISIELHEERRGVSTKAMIKDIDTIVIETDIIPSTGVPETGRSTGDSGFSTSQSRDPDKFAHSLGSHRSNEIHSDTDTLDDVVSLSSGVVLSQDTNKAAMGQGSRQGNKYAGGNSDLEETVKSNIVPPLKLTFGEEDVQDINNMRSNHSARTFLEKKGYNEYNIKEDENVAVGGRGVQSARDWSEKHKGSLHVHQDSAFSALPESRDLESNKLIAKPQAFELPPPSVSSIPNSSVPNKEAASLPNKVKERGSEFSPIESFPITPRSKHAITIPAVVSKPSTQTEEVNGLTCSADSKLQQTDPRFTQANIPAQPGQYVNKDYSMPVPSLNQIPDTNGAYAIVSSAAKSETKVNRELFPSDGISSKGDVGSVKLNRELFSGDRASTKLASGLFSTVKTSAEVNSHLSSGGVASMYEAKLRDGFMASNGKTNIHSETGARMKDSLVTSSQTQIQKPAIEELPTAGTLNKVAVQSCLPLDTHGASTSLMSSAKHGPGVTSQDTHRQGNTNKDVKSDVISSHDLYQQKIPGMTNGFSGDVKKQGTHAEVMSTGFQQPQFSGTTSGAHREDKKGLPKAAGEHKVVEMGVSKEHGVIHGSAGEKEGTGVERPKAVRQASVNRIHAAQEKLMMHHEEQLTKMTALCKQEMKLLMASRMTQKGFPEYVRALEEILSDKGRAILLLKSKIDEYVAMVNNE